MSNKNLITYDISIFTKIIPELGSLLGLDLGDKKIGISISNDTRTLAISYDTIFRTKLSEDIEILKKIVLDNKIVAIVIGIPLNLEGKKGKKAQSIRRISQEINKTLMLPLLFWDERYSTVAVEKKMIIEGNISRKKRKLSIDKSAATWILEGAIERIKKIR